MWARPADQRGPGGRSPGGTGLPVGWRPAAEARTPTPPRHSVGRAPDETSGRGAPGRPVQLVEDLGDGQPQAGEDRHARVPVPDAEVLAHDPATVLEGQPVPAPQLDHRVDEQVRVAAGAGRTLTLLALVLVPLEVD